MSTTSCRFYENKYPEVEELTVVNVRQIAEMGAYVRLLEYDNAEGMILLSELSRRRIRSIQKLVRVGRNEVVVVLRVDKEKGYIDLSKRRVSPEDIAKCEDRYNKAKSVHSIMRVVAEKHSMPLEELYETVGWPLYRKYGHAYEAFKQAITTPAEVFTGLSASQTILDDLHVQITRRLTPQAIKIRADVEVTCFAYDGIDAIKDSLKKGEAMSTPDCKIQIKLVAAPLFVVITNALDKTAGIKLLEDAISTITKDIREKGGNVVVKVAPRAQSEQDDLELQKMMEKAEAENLEVSGDEDDEEESEEEES